MRLVALHRKPHNIKQSAPAYFFFPNTELLELVYHVVVEAGKVHEVANRSTLSPALKVVQLTACITSGGMKPTVRIPDPDRFVPAPARHAHAARGKRDRYDKTAAP